MMHKGPRCVGKSGRCCDCCQLGKMRRARVAKKKISGAQVDVDPRRLATEALQSITTPIYQSWITARLVISENASVSANWAFPISFFQGVSDMLVFSSLATN